MPLVQGDIGDTYTSGYIHSALRVLFLANSHDVMKQNYK